jgi:hypothetical protein
MSLVSAIRFDDSWVDAARSPGAALSIQAPLQSQNSVGKECRRPAVDSGVIVLSRHTLATLKMVGRPDDMHMLMACRREPKFAKRILPRRVSISRRSDSRIKFVKV